MKILHCADIHLDSAMTSNMDQERAVSRRHELLITFIRMNEYAAEHDVNMILIAGDLFDTEFVTENTRQQVMSCIAHNQRIQYVYIEGNHDERTFMSQLAKCPDNLHFLEEGQSFDLEEVTVLAAAAPEQVNLAAGRTNIVMMHGEPDVKAFAGRNIDYLALGHLHTFRSTAIDERGVACYSGCLEGRGFDETGDKGFVLLEIGKTGRKLRPQFIPFSSRHVMECEVRMDGINQMQDLVQAIDEALIQSGARKCDMVRIKLIGHVSIEFHVNREYLKKYYENRFFMFAIKDDELKSEIDVDDYENDISLKGAFIRKVLASEYSESDQRKMMELGIAALLGEETF